MKSFAIMFAALACAAQVQAYAVKSLVTSASLPVLYAVVTFVDDGDATKKIAQTDAVGNYQVGLVNAVQTETTQPLRFELAWNYASSFPRPPRSLVSSLRMPTRVTI